MREDQGKIPSDLRKFLAASARIFANHGSEIGDELAAVLQQIDTSKIRLPKKTVAEPKLFQGLVPKSNADCAQPLRDCSTCLHWRKPGFGRLPATISKGIDVTEIVGPDGTLWNDKIRFGLLLQNPDHLYPNHNHAAEELYFVLAGRADWSADDGDPNSRGKANFVHHMPWQPHAIKTGPEPMLALWGWVGQIESSTYGLNVRN